MAWHIIAEDPSYYPLSWGLSVPRTTYNQSQYDLDSWPSTGRCKLTRLVLVPPFESWWHELRGRTNIVQLAPAEPLPALCRAAKRSGNIYRRSATSRPPLSEAHWLHLCGVAVGACPTRLLHIPLLRAAPALEREGERQLRGRGPSGVVDALARTHFRTPVGGGARHHTPRWRNLALARRACPRASRAMAPALASRRARTSARACGRASRPTSPRARRQPPWATPPRAAVRRSARAASEAPVGFRA